MDSRKLLHVATLARERGYSRAANKLGITQSALTRSIQALEEELGLRLFDRGRGGVHVTSAGQQLADEAQSILHRMEMLRHNMALLADRLSGEVTFGMGPLPASLAMADLLARIARDHRGLHVRTRLGSSGELLKEAGDGDLDFVVLSQNFVDPNPEPFTLRRVAQLQIAALVRQSHPLAGRTVSEADLAGWPIIGGTPNEAPRASATGDYAPRIICDNFDVMRDVTLNSDAIWITAEHMGKGQLAPLRGLRIAQQVQIVVASLTHRSLSPAALLLIEMVTEALRRASQANAA